MISRDRSGLRVIHFVSRALQREDPVCVTLHDWVLAEEFPAWAEVKSMLPELRSLWHHRNNLSVDDNGTLWRKRSSQSAQLQLLVPKAGREQLFLSYHASLFGGHLDGRGHSHGWPIVFIGRAWRMM